MNNIYTSALFHTRTLLGSLYKALQEYEKSYFTKISERQCVVSLIRTKPGQRVLSVKPFEDESIVHTPPKDLVGWVQSKITIMHFRNYNECYAVIHSLAEPLMEFSFTVYADFVLYLRKLSVFFAFEAFIKYQGSYSQFECVAIHFSRLLQEESIDFYSYKEHVHEDFLNHISWQIGDRCASSLFTYEEDFKSVARYILCAELQKRENALLETMDPEVFKDPKALLEALQAEHNEDKKPSYVLQKCLAQAELWAFMQEERFCKKFSGFHFEDIWRFLIDGPKEEAGAYVFENEPGYMLATLKAFKYALECPTFSVENYFELTRICGEGVFVSLETLEPFESGLRDYAISFSMETLDQDAEGIADLMFRSELIGNFFTLNAEDKTFSLRALSKEENKEKMNELFESHRVLLELAENVQERLLAHAWLARELELQHHWRDGNGRGSMLLLISLIANDPELPMALFYDPNILDVNGLQKLIRRVVEAMQRFHAFTGWTSRDPLTLESFQYAFDRFPHWEAYRQLIKSK